MSVNAIQPDYSNDIEYLERLSQGDETVETAEEIFQELENSESINFLFDFDEENESEPLNLTRDKYERTIDSLREREELRETTASRAKKHSLGQLGKIPGLIENPVEKGYQDADELEELSAEKLHGIITDEVEYSGDSRGRLITVGSASMFGGLGAIFSETFEVIADSMEDIINPENIQQAAQMTGEDMATTGVGVAATLYGLSSVHQSSFYHNGVEMRAIDEYHNKKAEEIIQNYSGREII